MSIEQNSSNICPRSSPILIRLSPIFVRSSKTLMFSAKLWLFHQNILTFVPTFFFEPMKNKKMLHPVRPFAATHKSYGCFCISPTGSETESLSVVLVLIVVKSQSVNKLIKTHL